MNSQYCGNLSIYFPCQLKGRHPLKWFHKMWNHCRDRQVRDVHMRRAPLTDLMDLEGYRSEKENILKILQGRLVGEINTECAPYALPCLCQAYQKIREFNLFTKCASVIISRFKLRYKGIYKEFEGLLLYNVNADNDIATYIVLIRFEDLCVEDIVLLKHIFYKRLQVEISEYNIDGFQRCNFEFGKQCDCFKCIKGKCNNAPVLYNSFQEYVSKKDEFQCYAKRYGVDFRARYSLAELDNDLGLPDKKDMYGIIYADEGYEYVSSERKNASFIKSLSYREAYDYYQCGLNGLIVNKYKFWRLRCKEQHAKFESRYDQCDKHVHADPIKCHCIAGVQEEFFPSFLKAAEIYYLINNVSTSEIENNDQSYINPFVFIPRSFKLWNILYELDVNRYNVNSEIQEAFGIKARIEEIREEYRTILQHTMNYAVIFFTIVQIIIGFVTFFKR